MKKENRQQKRSDREGTSRGDGAKKTKQLGSFLFPRSPSTQDGCRVGGGSDGLQRRSVTGGATMCCCGRKAGGWLAGCTVLKAGNSGRSWLVAFRHAVAQYATRVINGHSTRHDVK